MTGDKVDEEARRTASVIGATSKSGLKSEDRGLGRVLGLTMRQGCRICKKGGVAGGYHKIMAGSAVGGVRKRWRAVALSETLVLKDKMLVGSGGQGSNFLVMGCQPGKQMLHSACGCSLVGLGWYGGLRTVPSSGAAPRTARGFDSTVGIHEERTESETGKDRIIASQSKSVVSLF